MAKKQEIDARHYDVILAFVRERVRQKLQVSNPKLLEADAKRGIE